MTDPVAKEARKYPLVAVYWMDILGDPSWKEADQLDEFVEGAVNDLAISWGLLIKETDTEIVVAGSIRPTSDRHQQTGFGDVTVFPRGAVKKIQVLRKAR